MGRAQDNGGGGRGKGGEGGFAPARRRLGTAWTGGRADDPGFLDHALAEVRAGIVVVSGTNGKTTTTKMLAAVLGPTGAPVLTNDTGGNFVRGVHLRRCSASCVAAAGLPADIAVLELDEAHALSSAG